MNKGLLHKKVLNRELDNKLLAVNVNNGPAPFTTYEAMRNPEMAIQNATNNFKYTKEVGSDILPYVESNFLETLIPTIFGAEKHIAPGGSVDVKPVFGDIYETEKLGNIDIFNDEMEIAIKHLEFLKANVPEYLYVSPSRSMSPLDYAVVLCGGEFYTELYAEPELATAFMEKITDVTIRTIKEFKKIINQPIDECITPRGFLFNGIRLTGDAVVNLSPKMIEDIMCPFYKKFEKEFGKVMLHYCTAPSPSTHVAPALISGGGVAWVDNWQGYKTLLNESDYLRTDIGICTDIEKDIILSRTIKDIPFYNIKRPLVSSVKCDSIEEGNLIYEIWKKEM